MRNWQQVDDHSVCTSDQLKTLIKKHQEDKNGASWQLKQFSYYCLDDLKHYKKILFILSLMILV